jgi:phenylpropionate dioxygenase-like ring-hydroxylating dioxygenase large terminal subunit
MTVTAGLDPATYTEAEILAAERRAIFARCWHFVGLMSEIPANSDWLTAEIGGYSVIVQNFDGALRGFGNVCSHRHARLRAECRGNGHLRCPYHGWTYDKNGVPVGIPGNAEWFGLDRRAREDLALPPVAVESCGNLLFARIGSAGPNLADFLGAYHAIFAAASQTLGIGFAEGEVTWRCNWKIGVESAIEGYHLGMIHPATFKPFVRAVLPASWNGDHSLGPSLLSETALASMERIEARLGLVRLAASDRYDHYLIFPNFCLTITAGLTLSLQTYEPLTPDTLRLRFRLLTGASDRPALRDGVMGRAVLGAFAAFNDKVLEEDRGISEEVQRGKALARRPACLGDNEDRLRDFHAAWRRAMTA